MKFLVIGNGGREHAIIWKLAQSPKVDKIYCTLGNAGISKQAEIINIKVDDFEALSKFAIENKIDYTFVGPEVPLALGIVDFFNSKGLKIFGPSKKGALLEASKSFAKDFMKKYNVPTADYHTFTDLNKAKQFLETQWEENKKIVVKADGLAAGKGVVMCQNRQQALDALKSIMEDKSFGSAGDTVIFEQWLEGQETSVLVFVDGKHFSIMPAAQDHKRVNDGDKGLNTGGMGAYAPAPVATPELLKQVKEQVMPNIMNGLQKENIDYKGILYIGFMVDNGNPYVLEFNCRFGDPETQVILPLLETDLTDIVEHTINGTLPHRPDRLVLQTAHEGDRHGHARTLHQHGNPAVLVPGVSAFPPRVRGDPGEPVRRRRVAPASRNGAVFPARRLPRNLLLPGCRDRGCRTRPIWPGTVPA